MLLTLLLSSSASALKVMQLLLLPLSVSASPHDEKKRHPIVHSLICMPVSMAPLDPFKPTNGSNTESFSAPRSWCLT